MILGKLDPQTNKYIYINSNSNKSFPDNFLEVQDIYQPYFEKNKSILKDLFIDKHLNLNWVHGNYATDAANKKYDLIVSNPPYFVVGQGVLSPNEFKNRCRFFMDSDWQTMIHFIQKSLNPGGHAYFLVREELKSAIEKQFSEVSFSFQVRGTWVGYMKVSK